MVLSFNNPPLIELVVELRWRTPGLLLVDSGNAPTSGNSEDFSYEQLFMHFGAVASQSGYTQFERLIPNGFPLPPFQVAYRYKPGLGSIQNSSTLFQLGNGVFSINALPPDYKTWQHFTSVIKRGIEFLSLAFERIGTPCPKFDSAIVRYIDGFRGATLGDRTAREFMEVLGFSIGIPEVFEKISTDIRGIIPQLNLVVPTSVGQLHIMIADGQVQNDRAVIFDTSVAMQREINDDPETVIGVLTEARDVIHEVFLSITKPFHEAMEPIEVTQ